MVGVPKPVGVVGRVGVPKEVGVPKQVGVAGRVAEELRRAAGEGDLETVRRLLGLGADVDARDDSGFTPLQRASCEGRTEIVEYLVKQGGDVNAQDPQHGNSALHEASWKGYSQTAEILIKGKANVYLRNLGGFAPLHLACQNGHNQTCRVLLLAGCKPDIKNNYGDTPIHTAARYGHAGVTRILLSARANVKEVNKNGDTALHIAAAMGRRKLTKMLLEAAADQMTKNKQGESPIDIATRKSFDQILEILHNPPPIVTPEERLKQEQEEKIKEIKGKKEGERGRKDKRRDKMNDSGTSSKDSATKQKEKKKLKGDSSKLDPKTRAARITNWGVEWSPYGCHVSPPIESKIASPKMKTLPTDPLTSGEQYFIDLGGNIKKGPVGVGSTCFCAPLFQTVQHKMEKDKIDLMDHIDAAHGKLGARISSLESHTKGHILKLGDTVEQKIAQERDECRQRAEMLKVSNEKVVDSKVAQMQSWVEHRLAFHHPDSPPLSLRGKTLIGRGPSFRGKEFNRRDFPLVRSRSEEAVSEIAKDEVDEEPLYKGLRVLDYPTSMYNIPQRIEDTIDDSYNFDCSKPNQAADDTSLSHISFRNRDNQLLQSLLKVSEPEESSANECSTHKSSTVSDKHEDFLPSMNRSRLRYPLPPNISPSANLPDNFVPPDLNQAVNNMHVYETRHYSNADYADDYRTKQYDIGSSFPPIPSKPNVPLDSVNRSDSRYTDYRSANPYMYNLRETAPYMPSNRQNAATISDPGLNQGHNHIPPQQVKEEMQPYEIYETQPCNDPDTSTYLDMDRYRIQAAVRKLYNGYMNEGRIDPPRNGKTVLETSTEHDSHNDSGYSTRLCSASQGPSPALSGVPHPYGGVELNGRVYAANERLFSDHSHLPRVPPQPPPYGPSHGEHFRRLAPNSNGTSYQGPRRVIPGISGGISTYQLNGLSDGETNTSGDCMPSHKSNGALGYRPLPISPAVTNGDLLGESSLV